MTSEPEQTPETPAELDEKKLCVSCMFPNDPDDHFCAKCGAPMTSYAAIGPFESLFAEGYVYRQAVERPRKFIVVLGMWLIFGTVAIVSTVLLFVDRGMDLQDDLVFLSCAFSLPISLVLIWKTTQSYLNRSQANQY